MISELFLLHFYFFTLINQPHEEKEQRTKHSKTTELMTEKLFGSGPMFPLLRYFILTYSFACLI